MGTFFNFGKPNVSSAFNFRSIKYGMHDKIGEYLNTPHPPPKKVFTEKNKTPTCHLFNRYTRNVFIRTNPKPKIKIIVLVLYVQCS